jgi:serine/alanine adding enzyme
MAQCIIKNHKTIDQQAWNDYTAGQEHGTVFHSSEFFGSLLNSDDFEPFALFALDSDNKIRSMLQGFLQTVKKGLLALLSTRCILLKSPLYDDPEALSLLLIALKEFAGTRAVYTEIRSHYSDEISNKIYTQWGFNPKPHLNFVVDCSDRDKSWSNISESKRRQIRKSLANGAVIIDNPSSGQLDEFYAILRNLYAEKVRKPLPSKAFFNAMHQLSQIKPECIKFLFVSYQNKIIGGICSPISGKKAVHELYIAGLDEQYKELYPSSLATWAAIDYAVMNGIQTFDFMGAGKPDEDYGVREFKSRFGGILTDAPRYVCVHSPLRMTFAEAGFQLLQRVRRGL